MFANGCAAGGARRAAQKAAGAWWSADLPDGRRPYPGPSFLAEPTSFSHGRLRCSVVWSPLPGSAQGEGGCARQAGRPEQHRLRCRGCCSPQVRPGRAEGDPPRRCADCCSPHAGEERPEDAQGRCQALQDHGRGQGGWALCFTRDSAIVLFLWTRLVVIYCQVYIFYEHAGCDSESRKVMESVHVTTRSLSLNSFSPFLRLGWVRQKTAIGMSNTSVRVSLARYAARRSSAATHTRVTCSRTSRARGSVSSLPRYGSGDSSVRGATGSNIV